MSGACCEAPRRRGALAASDASRAQQQDPARQQVRCSGQALDVTLGRRRRQRLPLLAGSSSPERMFPRQPVPILSPCRMDQEWHGAVQRLIAGLQLGHDLTPDQQQQLFTDSASVAAPFRRSDGAGARAAAAASRWVGSSLRAHCALRVEPSVLKTAALHLAARWPLWRMCWPTWSPHPSSWPLCR